MTKYQKAEFTKSMKKTHTIYMPQMVHYHNELLCAAFGYGGYKLEIVPEYHEYCRETFSTINKDYCFCATGIVGNLLTFLKNNEDSLDHIAFLEPQAGGACRAGNYYNLIIECLRKSGYGQVPVLSLNYHGEEKQSGFTINAKMLFAALAAVCYGDLLMVLTQQIKPYEVNKGEAEALRHKWIERLHDDILAGRHILSRKKIYEEIIADYKKIEITERKLTKVGIVGEIYIKYSPVGNFHLEEFLEKHGCDYRQGGFLNYCIYVVYSEMKLKELTGSSAPVLKAYQTVVDIFCKAQSQITDMLVANNYKHDRNFKELEAVKGNILSDYYNIGDGWLMTSEIIDLIEQGYDKIMIVHPFGCLVSHVGGRGVIKAIKERYPYAKISSVEYDYDQSNTLRESRIMLAIS